MLGTALAIKMIAYVSLAPVASALAARLRGMMVMEIAVAAARAMVYVTTDVLVQARLGLCPSQVALAFGAFGAGSMLAAIPLPSS